MKLKLVHISLTILLISQFFLFLPQKPLNASVSGHQYNYSRVFGGSDGGDYIKDIVEDSNGNIIIVGLFRGTNTDLDGTTGVDNHTSNGEYDIFISKYSSSGNYDWTITIGGSATDSPQAVIVDSNNDIYLTGNFYSSSMDFDGTAGTDIHSPSGACDIFITKYESNGDYGWTRTFGGSGYDGGLSIDIDSSDNTYTTGHFEGTNIDFDATAGTDTHSSNGGHDVFITKYESDGDYGWTRTFGNSDLQTANCIQVGTDGSLFVGGYFAGINVDFDGTAGIDTHSSNGGHDVFITKYTTSGSYSWTRTFGSSVDDSSQHLHKDSSNNIHITGFFYESNVDFDGTAGTDTHSSNGNADAFITKYNNDGSYGWTRTWGGTSVDYARDSMIDANGNLYVVGQWHDTVDFDFTAGVDNHSSSQVCCWDIYLTKHSSAGSYMWTKSVGGDGTGDITTKNIISSTSGSMYYTGDLQGSTIDLDCTDGTDNYASAGSYDGFFTKMRDGTFYQIDSLPSGLDVEDTSGNNIEIGTSNGLYGSDVTVRLKDNSTGLTISDVNADLTADRDWASISGESNSSTGQSVVSNLTSAPGTASTHTLYIPIPTGVVSDTVLICPDASTMSDVKPTCSNVTIKRVGDSGVSKVEINSQDYWKVEGLTGTGGISLFNSFALKDTLTRLEISQSSDHTIQFGSVNGLLDIGDTIEVQFDPSGHNWNLGSIAVGDIDLEDDGTDLSLAAAADATHWGASINTGTDTITFTHPTAADFEDIAANSILVVKIGTVADGPGVNQIVNPSTAASYEITMKNTYSAGSGGTETGEVEIPIVDDDTVNITGYLDTTLSFDIDTVSTDTDCDASGGASPCDSHSSASDDVGYVVDLGEMTLTTVNKSGDSVLHADGLTGNINYIWFDLESNADGGTVVTVVSANEELSGPGSNSIPSVVTGSEQQIAVLSGLYGLNHRSGLVNTTAAGSLVVHVDCDCTSGDSYYCDIRDSEGSGTPIEIFNSNGNPVDDGRVQWAVGAAPDSDSGTGTYTDQLTFVATATF